MRRRALVALLACLPAGAGAQVDSVVVRPAPHYAAGGLKASLLGSGYRTLWTGPVRVEMLDLARFAGGLTPIEPGGGKQTRTLHMEDADGRRWIFRSVDKFVEQVLPPDLQRTFVHTLFQDHTSALHPTGALALPPLLDAVDVLHATPHLVVMPDDPRLGEHRREFAGMLGQIEERPNEGPDDTPGFAGSPKIVAMDRLLERIEEDPMQRPDEAGYLTARLIDFLVGDTDRGTDQWRWASVEQRDGTLLWRPIPRDRDWAFVRSRGPLAAVARTVFPKLVAFGPRYPSIGALTFSSIHNDRRLLSELPREAWHSVVDAIRSGVDDDVIRDAIASLPPEHAALEGERLAAALRARRDALPDVADAFYDRLAAVVDVRGTLEADVADIELLADGSVEVRLSIATSSATYFRRRFVAGETREVRVYLLDDDDRAVVRGAAATPIAVRVIGGSGADLLADSSRAGAAEVGLYDEDSQSVIVATTATRVDRDPFRPPAEAGGWFERRVARDRFRDWGGGRSLAPTVGYGEGAGVILGARMSRTRYGFRRVPYAQRVWIEGRYGTSARGFGTRAGIHRTRENSPWSVSLTADAEQFDAIRFYDFGNRSPRVDAEESLVMQDRVRVMPAVILAPDPATRLAFGARAQYTDPSPRPGSPLAASVAFGREGWGGVGAWLEGELDRRKGSGVARRGYLLSAATTAFPGIWDVPDWFGSVHAEARTYLHFGPTIALRAGGSKALGTFPVQEAAFVGGKATLRGFRYRRFAGDGALYGSAELRAPLTRALLLMRGDLGGFGFVDAGRVFLDGSSPGGFHTGYGGGLTFTSLGMTLGASYAHGEEDRFYVDLGMPF